MRAFFSSGPLSREKMHTASWHAYLTAQCACNQSAGMWWRTSVSLPPKCVECVVSGTLLAKFFWSSASADKMHDWIWLSRLLIECLILKFWIAAKLELDIPAFVFYSLHLVYSGTPYYDAVESPLSKGPGEICVGETKMVESCAVSGTPTQLPYFHCTVLLLPLLPSRSILFCH